jgi:hypothetical protein
LFHPLALGGGAAEPEIVGGVWSILIVVSFGDSTFPDWSMLLSVFGPTLRKQDSGLNCFAEPDFIGEYSAAGERRPKGKKRRFDLVRVESDLGIG